MNWFRFNHGWGNKTISPLKSALPLDITATTGKPILAKGVGPVTFTRSSKQWVADHEGVLRPVYDGCAAIDGSRIVTNLLLNSTTLSTQSVALDGGVYRITAEGAGSVTLSGVATGTLSPSSVRRSLLFTATKGTLVCTVSGSITNTLLQNVTGATNQNPSEYIPTTSTPITQCFNYLNPYTVDVNGVVTDSGTRTPIANIKGILLGPASTNKCTNYNIIPGDTLGGELITNGGFDSDTGWSKDTGWTVSGGVGIATDASSGVRISNVFTCVIGKIYQVTYTIVSISKGGIQIFARGAAGTIRTSAGTYTENITVGTSTSGNFALSSVGTTTAIIDNVSVKEIILAVGTTASSLNPTAIAGMTLSGYTQTTGNLVVGAKYKINSRSTLDFTTCGAANNTAGTVFTATVVGTLGAGDSVDNQSVTLSIVDDTTTLAVAGLLALNPSGKVYKLDNSLGGVTIIVAASGQFGNTNTSVMSIIARSNIQSWLRDSSLNNLTAIYQSDTYQRVCATPFTPVATRTLAFSVGASGVLHTLANQIEELPYCTSIIPTAGATGTRAATLESIPTPAGVKCGYYELNPAATNASLTRWIWASYTDVNNAIGMLFMGSSLIFRKRVVGTNYDATIALTETANTAYKVMWRVNADNSTDIFVGGVKGTGNSNTTAPVWASSIRLGEDGNNANYGVARFRNFRIYKKPLSDAKCIALTT